MYEFRVITEGWASDSSQADGAHPLPTISVDASPKRWTPKEHPLPSSNQRRIRGPPGRFQNTIASKKPTASGRHQGPSSADMYRVSRYAAIEWKQKPGLSQSKHNGHSCNSDIGGRSNGNRHIEPYQMDRCAYRHHGHVGDCPGRKRCWDRG